ncbi:response regulator [Vibrio tapetis]|nr:response regulator [Vibrio tapetis]
MKLKRKNGILLAVISSALLVVAMVLISQAARYAENVESAYYQKSVEEIGDEVEKFILERTKDVRVLRESTQVLEQTSKTSFVDSLTDKFNLYIDSYRVYQNMVLFSPDGNVLVENTQSYDGDDVKPILGDPMTLSTRPWFKDTLKTERVSISQVFGKDIYFSVLDKHKKVLVLSSPIFDEKDNVSAVLAVVVDISNIKNIISGHFSHLAALSTHRYSTYATTEQGNHVYVVASENFDIKSNFSRTTVAETLTHIRETNGANSFTIQGDYLVSWAQIVSNENAPRIILFFIPTSDVFKNITLGKWYAMAMAFGLVLTLCFAGFHFISRIGSPLQKIEGVIASLSKNDLDVDLPEYKELDEISGIIDSLKIYKNQLIERGELFERVQTQKEQLDVQFQAIESANACILVLAAKKDNAVLYANKAMLSLVNKAEDEIKGMRVRDLYDSELNLIQVEEIIQALDSELSLETSVCFKGHDDGLMFFNLFLSPVYSDSKEIASYILVHNDVSDLRRVEAEILDTNFKLEEMVEKTTMQLEGSESQMNLIFQSALDGMLLVGSDEKIMDINLSAERMFGWKKIDIVGSLFESLISEKFNIGNINYLKDSNEGKEGTISERLREAIGVTKTGNFIPLDILVTQMSLDDETLYFVTFRDISDRKHTESELKYSKRSLQETIRRLNLTTEAGEIGIWNWNFITGGLEWDDRMYRMYQKDPDTCDNTYDTWRTCVLEEDVEQAEVALMEAKNSLTRFFAEFRIRWPNGEIRWIKASADVIFDENSGVAIGMGGVNLDVTEEKNSQELLRRESEAANAANGAKSLFLANMSHEIRTPMNGVVGMIDLLNDTDLSFDQQSMTTTIKDSSLHLLSIINDILDFSKIEANQMSVEHLPVPLQVTVEKTADVLWLQANQNNAAIYIVYDPNIPNLILSDGVRLGQVLFNVLGNAVKFSKGDEKSRGEIWLKAQLESNESNADKKGTNKIAVTIQDNGIGMSAEQLENLFKSFTQGDASTTRLYGGTGLGLSISHSLVEMMGGTISVESQQWVGTTFRVELPCDDASVLDAECEDRCLENMNIVTVIGEESLQTAVKENLELQQCKVLSLNSLEKLKLLMANDDSFDVVILGSEFSHEEMKAITKVVELRSTRIILLANEPAVKLKGLPGGNVALGVCPLKPSELVDAVLQANGRKHNSNEIENQEYNALEDNFDDNIRWKILVAEDQPTNRDVIERQLSKLGYQCLMAENGSTALELWKKQSFDLVLTDCHMPVMDGFELTRAIRDIEKEQQASHPVPIVALTANALLGAADSCIEAGMDDYLSKPIELQKLKTALNLWLNDDTVSRENSALLNHTNTDLTEAVSDLTVELNTTLDIDQSRLPIDCERLSEILGTDEEEILYPLLEGYWESIQDDLASLTTSFQSKDREQIQGIAHAAKGAAKSAGADPLGDTFKIIQDEALEADWEELNNHLNQAITRIEEIEQWLIERAIISKGAA